MKKLLLISEKRDQSNRICDALNETGHIDQNTLIDCVFVMPMSWWHYKIPSHISMSDIPFSQTPSLEDLVLNPIVSAREYNEPTEENRSIFWLFSLDSKFNHDTSSLKPSPATYELGIESVIPEIASRIDDYDEIIVAPDSDHSGWNSAFRWMSMLDRQIRLKNSEASFFDSTRKIRGLWMNEGLDTASLFRSYNANTPLTDYRIQTARNIGDSKRIFDYWWFYNSAAIFTKVLRNVGVESPKILSKYELMILHLLRKWGEPIQVFSLFKSMETWLGTGKYRQYEVCRKPDVSGFEGMCLSPLKPNGDDPNRADMIWGQIGSAMSRYEIIKNLSSMGLVDLSSERRTEVVSISQRGLKFLDHCHKATFDPDLPFRLAVWCQNQEHEKMARYIRTVFGKQKRLLSRLNSQAKVN